MKYFFICILIGIVVFFQNIHAQGNNDHKKYSHLYDSSQTIFRNIIDIYDSLFQVPVAVPRLDKRPGLTTQLLDIGNVKLYIQREGKGVPLVLLHGGPGSTSHYFHPWFQAAAAFCDVIYYDQRGCGLSEYKRDSGYTINQSVSDLENLRKKLGIQKWVVLGHSFGGYLAQYYAVKHPQNILGIILVDAAVPMQLADYRNNITLISPQEQKIIDDIWNTPGSDYPRKIYNAFMNGDWKRQKYYKPMPERMAQIALYDSKSDTVFNTQLRRSMTNIDLTGYFMDCPVPTMLIEGRWDFAWHPSKAYNFSMQHPNGKLVMMENSNHNPFAEEPSVFFNILASFIKGLPVVNRQALNKWISTIKAFDDKQWLQKRNEDRFMEMLNIDFNTAMEHYRQQKRKNPVEKLFREATIISQARQLLNKNEVDKSIQLFKICIEEYPRATDAYEHLGNVYLKTGDKRSAIEYYRKAYRLNPSGSHLRDRISELLK
jgi:proline iminopeptidase